MNIYVTGPIAYERAKELLEENRQFLKERFPVFFLKQFECIEEQTCDIIKNDVAAFEISEGGLFGALWTAMAELKKGCEINLRDIPVRQEVIEIMELFDENPYESSSKGAWLIVSDKHEDYSLIGYTTDKKDRVVVCEDQRRFLTPLNRQLKDIADRQRVK